MSEQASLGVEREPTEREWLEGLRYEDKFPMHGEHNYLGKLCAKDGCPNVPTPGYLLCADCAAAGGNV